MKKVFDALEKIIRYTCYVLFASFHLLIFVQVFTRYVLGNSLTWTELAARYLFIWMIMLFVPIVTRGMENLSFDVILGKLPKKVKDITITISDAAVCAFAVYWFYWSTQLCIVSQGRIFQGLHIAKNWVYAAQPVGAFLLFLFSVELVIIRIKHITETNYKEVDS